MSVYLMVVGDERVQGMVAWSISRRSTSARVELTPHSAWRISGPLHSVSHRSSSYIDHDSLFML